MSWCNTVWSSKEEQIRNRIVIGISGNNVSQKLQLEPELSLELSHSNSPPEQTNKATECKSALGVCCGHHETGDVAVPREKEQQ